MEVPPSGEWEIVEKPLSSPSDKLQVSPELDKKISGVLLNKQRSLAFTDAKKQAKKLGIPDDQVELWAIINHDPYKDGYSVLQILREMKDPIKIRELESKMLKNPILRKIMEWGLKRGLEPSYKNFMLALKDGDLDMVKFFIAKGYEPNIWDLNTAVSKDKLAIVKFLMIEKGLTPDPVHNTLIQAILNKNPEMVRLLVETGKIPVAPRNLGTAEKYGTQEIYDILKNALARQNPQRS